MVVSGITRKGEVGKSLQSVGLWLEDSSVKFFETLNNALEYCENVLLQALYRQRDASSTGSDTQSTTLGM